MLWNFFSPAAKFGKLSSKDDGSSFKAALLSGPPGVGKTTTASLVCQVGAVEWSNLQGADSSWVCRPTVCIVLKSDCRTLFGSGEVCHCFL